MSIYPALRAIALWRNGVRSASNKKDYSLTNFSDFNLNGAILKALTEEKYETPTPIQAQTIPIAITGRDVVGIAQTGTGKTAAFALPILHRLAQNPRVAERKTCRVLVLSPTRELSGQILDSFRAYGRHLRLRTALAIGGVSMGAQVRSLLNGVDVLVATPGRLLDLVRANALRLNGVECFVLDEADRMLDMGFINDIRKIVAKLPAERQTLMFSATMPRAIADLAEDMLRDPEKVAVTPVASTAERITQRIIRVDRADKHNILVDVLRNEPSDRVLVFTRTKHGADKVARKLGQSGIPAEAIHGNKSQGQRERALSAFRDGKVKTLVATDIAARGIDVDGVSHVVNFDLPNVAETYVHRIGRTARAGAEGVAISLCDAEEAAYLRDIEKLIRISLPVTDKRAHPDRGEARTGKPARSHAPGKHLPGSHGKSSRANGGAGKDGSRAGGRNNERHWHRADKPRKQPHQGQPQQGNHAQTNRGHANHNQPRDIASVAFLHAGAPQNRG